MNLFGRTLDDAVTEAKQIVKDAWKDHEPKFAFALFSGGSDSTTMLDICEPYIDGVLHIDTTCGIRQTREYVEEECARRGLTLYVQRPPASYEEIVRERGFFGPKDHPYAYRLLKKAAVRDFKRQWLAERGSTIMFLTGMRSAESGRRMAHGAGHRLEERIWWVNPIRHFSTEEKNAYIETHNLRTNPVSDVLGKSGECNCGCFAAGPFDKEVLRDLDPELVAMFERLEAELEAKGSPFCKWGPGGGNGKQVCACFGQEAMAL